jgi:hypothetical protein
MLRITPDLIGVCKIVQGQGLTSAQLEPYLRQCGYVGSLLRPGYTFGGNGIDLTAEWAGFSHEPADARSACLAAIDCQIDPASVIPKYRPLGAPFIFACQANRLHWWQHEVGGSRLLETIEATQVPGFFQTYQKEFDPLRVYRAKTRGRFESHYQLSFVDIGLMPLVEGETGERLGDLIQRLVAGLKSQLKPRSVTTSFGHWMFQSVFWLVAAKILKDKGVAKFKSLSLDNPDDVFDRVARHYDASPVIIRTSAERAAIAQAATNVAQFASTVNVTTESLAYVYENTLVSKATRAALGTHSTPAWLVDYIVWQLAPFIEKLPPDKRHVFEPACGHAAFLVAALRLLREQNPAGMDDAQRLKYLRQHLHGVEVDDFAGEIARLSLTLADIPNPNGWDIQGSDMFASDMLKKQAAKANILFCNPPYEDFSDAEYRRYKAAGFTPAQKNKAAQVLAATLPQMPAESVFGLVLPQGILHNKSSRRAREALLGGFKIEEICLFPDKVFEFSDHESVVIIGRKLGIVSNASVRYRRVGEHGIEKFRLQSKVAREQLVPQGRFRLSNHLVMRAPDFLEIWEHCRSLRRLSDVAQVAKGLDYLGADKLPRGAITISKTKFAGAVRGYAHLPKTLQLHTLPQPVWMSLEDRLVGSFRASATTGVPQVLLNYAPVSRDPWKVKAVIDRKGLAFSTRLIAVRPKGSMSLECLWALCNSPVANAFVDAHLGKRDILVGTFRELPIPTLEDDDINSLNLLVERYFKMPSKKILMQIDSLVLRRYNLPIRMETQLLCVFDGERRRGVPFGFAGYYPAESPPLLPLHLLLSLPRFHELADRKLSKSLSEKQAAELASLEAEYDVAEDAAVAMSRRIMEIERQQLEATKAIESVERQMQKLLAYGAGGS